ncbi:MAG: ATP-binding protein [bacterium]|nr:ATP-binding protein [bacterium]
MQNLAITIVAALALLIGLFSQWKSRQFKIDLEKREEETRRRMYELAILKELGDRVGYSLNVQNIIDIITGSLHQFIEYSATSYMFLEPEKIIFKVHLEKSVSRKFIDDIKDRMIKSISALLSQDFKKMRIEEILSGAILVEELAEPVRSFFNIPLVIADKVVGVLTIAHTKIGLYKEEEMTILYKIVRQASQAVTRLEEVVRIEEKKLNAMVASITEGVIMTDGNYRVMVANPAAKQALALEKKDEPTIFDFIDNLEGKFDIRGKLEESVKLDKILLSPNILIRDRFYQITVAPVKSSLGMNQKEILGGVVILHDITREKEVEKMRADFTSMIVHELRTPLDATKKIIELISTGKVSKDKKDNYLKMIYRDSSSMLDLVNNLLDAAKIESEKFEINPEPADIKNVILDRVSFFETSAAKAKIKIYANFDKNLPANVKFDVKRISQVLNNLLANSLKYSKPDGLVNLQAILHAKGKDITEEAKRAGIILNLKEQAAKLSAAGDSLAVAVTDSGIGISEENQKELFSKFKQLKQTDSKNIIPGTGLGLVIARGIVEAHQGMIGVESKEGLGSTFYFTIPLKLNNLNNK